MVNLLPIYAGLNPKVEILDAENYHKDNTNLTVVFREEDHTIGNMLKEVISKMKGVEFCGYNIPHPLEDKILIRIQTYKGYSAGDLLIQALNDSETIINKIEEKFDESYSAFKN